MLVTREKGLCTDRHNDLACADQAGGAWAGSRLTAAEQDAQRGNTGSAWAGQVSSRSPLSSPHCIIFQSRLKGAM